LLFAVYWVQWPYVWTCALNWYEVQFFFRIPRRFCLIYNLRQT
jgi:hypothetical protein